MDNDKADNDSDEEVIPFLSDFVHSVDWSDSTGEYFRKPCKDGMSKPVEYATMEKVLNPK